MVCDDAELTRAIKFLLRNPGLNGRFTFGNIKPLEELINDVGIANEAAKLNMTPRDYIDRIRACVNAAPPLRRLAAAERLAADGGKRRSHRRKHGRRNTRGKRSKRSKRSKRN